MRLVATTLVLLFGLVMFEAETAFGASQGFTRVKRQAYPSRGFGFDSTRNMGSFGPPGQRTIYQSGLYPPSLSRQMGYGWGQRGGGGYGFDSAKYRNGVGMGLSPYGQPYGQPHPAWGGNSRFLSGRGGGVYSDPFVRGRR